MALIRHTRSEFELNLEAEKNTGIMRFTIIDDEQTISFTGEGHLVKALSAACAKGPGSVRELLANASTYDDQVESHVLSGLAVFDEHVLADEPETIAKWSANVSEVDNRPFRVLDQNLRNASLTADGLGVILFNIPERRIIQIENHYGPLLRVDRSRFRRDGAPTDQTYAYSLPKSWSIVP